MLKEIKAHTLERTEWPSNDSWELKKNPFKVDENTNLVCYSNIFYSSQVKLSYTLLIDACVVQTRIKMETHLSNNYARGVTNNK